MSRLLAPILQRIILLAVIAPTANGFAHDFLEGYIQHRLEITVSARQLDLAVQLTFFEDASEHERAEIDSDKDGRLSAAEVEAYLKRLEAELAKAVTLQVDGHPAVLLALYPAELDLLGNARTGRAHHRLTLHYFVPRPPQLRAGSELTVSDRLWPQIRALGELQAVGKDGCRLEAVGREDPVFAPARKGEARVFNARVLAPPRPSPDPPIDNSVHSH